MRIYLFRQLITVFVLTAFLGMMAPVPGRAGEVFLPAGQAGLPAPGARMAVSPAFMPPMILGITVDAIDPLKFNFLIDQGDQKVPAQDQEEEFKQLIKYFLASLTIPEKDLWVNLSPYEGQRIIPPAFGQTEMGRDLLGQDYVLKQITASLIYPESELGKKFWADVYKKAHEQFGTTNIPVNTFNKVWIVPDEAMVYEHDGTAFVVKSHLKVMLEEDYLALAKHQTPTRGHVPAGDVSPSTLPSEVGLSAKAPQGQPRYALKDVNALGSQVVRQIILPALEKEVNEGKNFALLRQINNALVLATWYKRALKESLLGKFYVDKAKVKGVDHADRQANEKIYQRYLEAFKKGVYNFIKEDRDPYTQQTIPRKYFSGGFEGKYAQVVQVTRDQSQVSEGFIHRIKEGMDGRIVDVAMRAEELAAANDKAMISEQKREENSRMTVLVVDDESAIREMLSDVLQDEGYKIETAQNGQEALDKVSKGHVNLVLSDRNMPMMDGIKLAQELQKRYPDLPVMIVTGDSYEIPEDVRNSVGNPEFNIKRILDKPVPMKDLYGAVEALKPLMKKNNISPVETAKALEQVKATQLKRILFVDDNKDMRFLTSTFLREAGFEVETAVSGEDALKKDLTRYSGIITDYNMPGGMNGEEFVKQARQQGFSGPFIIQTDDFEVQQRWKSDKPEGVVAVVNKDEDNIIKALKDHQDKFFPVDAAMNAAAKAPGGIDLNPVHLNLRIKRDGKGVPLPIGRQDMGDLGRIEGLVPVIIKIVPATHIPALSALIGEDQNALSTVVN